MARVPYPKKEDLPEQDRHIYERMVRERGGGHIWLALANHPKVLEGVMAMAGALRNETKFDRRYRELGIVMVGLITKSDYEFDHHWNAALQAGVKSHFDIQQTMEVVLTVAWYNCVVRILLPLQIEHERGFKRN
jgi:alkylhydroperoxidase family enzyme